MGKIIFSLFCRWPGSVRHSQSLSSEEMNVGIRSLKRIGSVYCTWLLLPTRVWHLSFFREYLALPIMCYYYVCRVRSVAAFKYKCVSGAGQCARNASKCGLGRANDGRASTPLLPVLDESHKFLVGVLVCGVYRIVSLDELCVWVSDAHDPPQKIQFQRA